MYCPAKEKCHDGKHYDVHPLVKIYFPEPIFLGKCGAWQRKQDSGNNKPDYKWNDGRLDFFQCELFFAILSDSSYFLIKE